MGPPAWSGLFTYLVGHAADGVVLRRGLAHSPRRTQCCRRDHRRREYASRLIARAPRDPLPKRRPLGDNLSSVRARTEMSCSQPVYCNRADTRQYAANEPMPEFCSIPAKHHNCWTR